LNKSKEKSEQCTPTHFLFD